MASHPDFVNYMPSSCGSRSHPQPEDVRRIWPLLRRCILCRLCDDQLFVKVTPQGEAAFPDLPKAPPYEGARDSFLVEDVENREQMTELVRITCEALRSGPQRKRRK